MVLYGVKPLSLSIKGVFLCPLWDKWVLHLPFNVPIIQYWSMFVIVLMQKMHLCVDYFVTDSPVNSPSYVGFQLKLFHCPSKNCVENEIINVLYSHIFHMRMTYLVTGRKLSHQCLEKYARLEIRSVKLALILLQQKTVKLAAIFLQQKTVKLAAAVKNGKVSSNFSAAKNGQVSSNFAAAKNGKVGSNFMAEKNGQVSTKFLLAQNILLAKTLLLA